MSEIQNPFKGSELTTILVISDMARAKAFYTDVLGAQLFREYGGDSTVLKLMEHWILLVTGGGPTEDKPDTVFEPIEDRNKVNHSFTIRVENCQESYDILSKRGAKFISPPVVNGNETRCFFYDPDGHLFEISEYRV